jgi:hypothetical protein
LEIVLARYDEDISWLDGAHMPFTTVYDKGGEAGGEDNSGTLAALNATGRVKALPNVGREGHTFLWHVVNNYDTLADWTVFSQARAPAVGYGKGSHDGEGHLLSGVSFQVGAAKKGRGRRGFSSAGDPHFVFPAGGRGEGGLHYPYEMPVFCCCWPPHGLVPPLSLSLNSSIVDMLVLLYARCSTTASGENQCSMCMFRLSFASRHLRSISTTACC